jgi:hypothetical protein
MTVSRKQNNWQFRIAHYIQWDIYYMKYRKYEVLHATKNGARRVLRYLLARG